MKILVAIAHYFSPESLLNSEAVAYGALDGSKTSFRTSVVSQCISSYKSSLENLGFDFELRIYGITGSNLLPIDVDLTSNVTNSQHIPWAMIDHVYKTCEDFDFVLLSEDDIEVNAQTIDTLIKLDRQLKPWELLIPNRIEKFEGLDICVDMFALPGWLKAEKFLMSGPIRCPKNTHSALLLFTADKFRIAYSKRKNYAPAHVGSLGYLESALTNLLSEFVVYRALPTSSAVTIVHLDSWLSRGVIRGDFSKCNVFKFLDERDRPVLKSRVLDFVRNAIGRLFG